MAQGKLKIHGETPYKASVIYPTLNKPKPKELIINPPAHGFTTTEDQCFYCEEKLTTYTRTRDHIKPKSKGYKLHEGNKVWACQICNTHKGDLPLELWAARLSTMKNIPTQNKRKLYLIQRLDKILTNIEKLKHHTPMQRLPESEVKVKMALCPKCTNPVMVGIEHMMDKQGFKELNKLVKEGCDIKTIPLLEYRKMKFDLCNTKCDKNK